MSTLGQYRRRTILPIRVLALVVVAATASRGAAAQRTRVPVAPGARVRAEAPGLGAGRSTWDVADVRPDTLLLVPAHAGGPRVAVALADVSRLEVNRGPLRNTLLGGAAGLALGAAAGAVYGRSRPGPFADVANCLVGCTPEQYAESQRPRPGDWAVLGAIPGLTLGVLVGRFAVGDRWQRVVPGPARLSVAPGARGGLRVALAVPAR
jgi:hypothetical protein